MNLSTHKSDIIWLDVPYKQKDDAKKLGARWNPKEKKWYSPSFSLLDRGLKRWWTGHKVKKRPPKGINRRDFPIYRKKNLEIELVPSTCWFSNVRSNVSREDWDKLKKIFNKKANYRCEICHGQGLEHPVELHEIWKYDDLNKVQKLEGMISLCPACHEVKHLGLANIKGRDKQAIEWLKTINEWTDSKVTSYVRKCFDTWEKRSTFEWDLDIKLLNKYGINSLVKDSRSETSECQKNVRSMNLEQIEREIRKEIEARDNSFNFNTNWYTPSGKRRSVPVYETNIENEYLGLQKMIKSRSQSELEDKVIEQFRKWAEQEIKLKLQDAKNDKGENVKKENKKLADERNSLSKILESALPTDNRLEWEKLKEKDHFPTFQFKKQKPDEPIKPIPNVFQKIVPILFKKKIENYEHNLTSWKNEVEIWNNEKSKQKDEYEKEKKRFYSAQKNHNHKIDQLKNDFESGKTKAIIEYINIVFERSVYPSSFRVEYHADYDLPSKNLVVDIHMPSQDKINRIKELKYQKTNDTIKEIQLKDKEHGLIYDRAIKQCVLRTIHEIFRSIYIDAVEATVINAWVNYVDPSTGNDKVSCILSISTTRENFDNINLEKVDIDACIKGLKGLVAGPLDELAPVKPIMQLNREDKRFVESREQLADLNSATNLAEMHWEDFEHLVRELFGKLFAAEGAEVKVTQASSDGGIDAVVFDPDPIRGGKFVIQAKRYTKTVGVSAVRDLYGTMINEGAVKGILVTTASYGRDSREFAKDKPISLIDGSNLVYMLEEHGYKARINLQEARNKLKD